MAGSGAMTRSPAGQPSRAQGGDMDRPVLQRVAVLAEPDFDARANREY
jgi:hypothetical protein